MNASASRRREHDGHESAARDQRAARVVAGAMGLAGHDPSLGLAIERIGIRDGRVAGARAAGHDADGIVVDAGHRMLSHPRGDDKELVAMRRNAFSAVVLDEIEAVVRAECDGVRHGRPTPWSAIVAGAVADAGRAPTRGSDDRSRDRWDAIVTMASVAAGRREPTGDKALFDAASDVATPIGARIRAVVDGLSDRPIVAAAVATRCLDASLGGTDCRLADLAPIMAATQVFARRFPDFTRHGA